MTLLLADRAAMRTVVCWPATVNCGSTTMRIVALLPLKLKNVARAQ